MYIFTYVLSLLSGLVNPYIGIYSLFNAIALLIISSFVLNGTKRVNLANFADKNGYSKEGAVYRKSGKVQLTVAIVVSISCFAVCVFIYAVVWLISVRSYNGDTVNTPIDIFSLQYNYVACGILLVVSLFFHLMGVFLVIRERKTVLKAQTAYLIPEDLTFNNVSFNLTTDTIIFLIGALILCFACGYISWSGMAITLFYFISWIILKISIRSLTKNKDSSGFVAIQARYGLLQIQQGGRLNALYIILCWVIALIAIIVEFILMMSAIEVNPYVLTGIGGIVSGIGAMIFELLTAYSLGRNIKQITVN